MLIMDCAVPAFLRSGGRGGCGGRGGGLHRIQLRVLPDCVQDDSATEDAIVRDCRGQLRSMQDGISRLAKRAAMLYCMADK